jgi:hypothetical protein
MNEFFTGISALATFVSALATLGLLWVTRQYVNQTKKLVDETATMRKIQSDPLVIVDFFEEEHGFSSKCLVFKNVGKSTAYNIKATFSFKSDPSKDLFSSIEHNLNTSGVVNPGIHFLQPERSYALKVGGPSDYRELYGLTIHITLSYYDEQQNPISKEYHIDFNYLKGVLSSTI